LELVGAGISLIAEGCHCPLSSLIDASIDSEANTLEINE